MIALQSRRVTIAGIHPQPYGTWMEQMARTLTDPVDGCLRRARYLMHDRDPLDTRVFGEILEGGGVQPIRLPPKSPNLNAYAERFVRSMKEECLSRVVPLGEGHVRLLVGEYVEHDHRERNHQGLDNQLLQRPPPPVSLAADVQRRERLGGLLNFYHREAASSGRPIKRTLRRPCRCRPQRRARSVVRSADSPTWGCAASCRRWHRPVLWTVLGGRCDGAWVKKPAVLAGAQSPMELQDRRRSQHDR